MRGAEQAILFGKQTYKPKDSYFFSWNNCSLKLGYWHLRCWLRTNIPLPNHSYYACTLWEGYWGCLTKRNSQLENTSSIFITEYQRQHKDNEQFMSEKLLLLTAARDDLNTELMKPWHAIINGWRCISKTYLSLLLPFTAPWKADMD